MQFALSLLLLLFHLRTTQADVDESDEQSGRKLRGFAVEALDPRTIAAKLEGISQCWAKLPPWVLDITPETFKREMETGSAGLTDKTTMHHYHHIYHRYLSTMTMRTCAHDHPKTIRMLEIGLGCSPGGGMILGQPGGSTRAWRHLFTSSEFKLDLHVMEFDAECANKWAKQFEGVAVVHTGDASVSTDLDRVVRESGGQPFDVIIDDASHLNEHQIKTFEAMIGHVKQGGVYIIEDIFSSCRTWRANVGSKSADLNLVVKGTHGCMKTSDGKPTIFSMLVEWQKKLVEGQEPFQDVIHVDLSSEVAVIGKRLMPF
jgi:hypothetical protein